MSTVISPTWLKNSKKAATFPQWLNDLCEHAHAKSLVYGLPTNKDEAWKYTDLNFLSALDLTLPVLEIHPSKYKVFVDQYRFMHPLSLLIVIINGKFVHPLSDKLPKEIIFTTLEKACIQHESLIRQCMQTDINAKRYPFANLNVAHMQEGHFLYVPDKVHVERPLHLLHITTGDETFIQHPNMLIVSGKESKLTLVEEHISDHNDHYLQNILTRVEVQESAQLDYYKIQNLGPKAVHVAHTFLQQAARSIVNLASFSVGAHFARDELNVQLNGEGSECTANGFYKLNEEQQYIDHHIDISHQAPHTYSSMLYKGIINKKARAVFNGRLYVDKSAQQVVAHQANHTLLLSSEAEMYSKPELEIYANEVKCKHGATSGQLDTDALFYLRSRGLEQNAALRMLIQSFAHEVVQRLKLSYLRDRLKEQVTC